MAYLRQRSKLLTAYLEGLIRNTFVERKKVNLEIGFGSGEFIFYRAIRR